jgi:hypothetical protein
MFFPKRKEYYLEIKTIIQNNLKRTTAENKKTSLETEYLRRQPFWNVAPCSLLGIY